MLSRIIAAFCMIDDALQALGHQDDPQAKTPASAILTLAVHKVRSRVTAAMELGGKHNRTLALAKDLNLFAHVPSPSCFNRRLHTLYPLLLPLLHLLAQVWKKLHQAQAYALDTFPLPTCEKIRAPAPASSRTGPTAGLSPASGSTSTASSSTSWWTTGSSSTR